MTKPTYEQLEAHLNKCQSQRARLENQLADHIKREVMLRDALHDYKWNKDEWGFIKCVTEIIEALAATADLKGLRVCHAKPSAWLRDDDKGGSINTMSDCCTNAVKELLLRVNPKNVERYTIPVFSAWEPK